MARKPVEQPNPQRDCTIYVHFPQEDKAVSSWHTPVASGSAERLNVIAVKSGELTEPGRQIRMTAPL